MTAAVINFWALRGWQQGGILGLGFGLPIFVSGYGLTTPQYKVLPNENIKITGALIAASGPLVGFICCRRLFLPTNLLVLTGAYSTFYLAKMRRERYEQILGEP